MGFKLAELFVEFVTKGVDGTLTAINKVHDSLTGVKAGMEKVATAAVYSWGIASASIAGFVRAGLSGTAMAAQLSFQMNALSRNIAGLFAPEIQRAINLVRSLVEWFRGLTDEQRSNIVRWIEGATVAAGVAILLPRIVSGIQAVILGLRALAVAIAGVEASTGIGAILPLIGAAAAAITALVIGTEAGRGALGKFWDVLKGIAEALGKIFAPIAAGIGAIVEKLTDAFDAIAGPLLEALKGIAEAFAPLGEAIGGLAASVGDVLAGAFKVVAEIVIAALNVMRPFISVLVQIASVVVNVVVVAFKGLALVLESIARMLAFITGVDFDKVKVGKPEQLTGNRREIAPGTASFGSPEQVYNQIAQASVMLGKSVPEQQLDEQRNGNMTLEKIRALLAEKRPAIA